MQSKTSFFSFTLFKKTITRFTPLWVAYFLGWFLLLPMPLMTQYSNYANPTESAIDWILEIGIVGGIASAVLLAPVAAMLVFSAFCSQKSVGAYTSLPIRREGLYLSCFGAGLSIVLVVNIIIAAITGIVAGIFWVPFSVTLKWLLVVSLLDIAFFGMAALAAGLTGNVFGIPVMYAVINFGIVAIESLLVMFLYSVSFGMTVDRFPITEAITPILSLIDNVEFDYHPVADIRGMWCIWLWAGVGALMAVGALLLFKFRHMERASDIAANRFVRVAFRVLAAAAGAGAGYVIYYIFFGASDFDMNPSPIGLAWMLVWMIIGLSLGWFCGEMLLKKTLKVFTKKNFLRIGITGFCLAAALVLAYIDPLGLGARLPEADEIARVDFYSYGHESHFEEPENIEAALEINRSVIQNKTLHRRGGRASTLVRFNYTLTDGSSLDKAYYLADGSEDRTDYYLMFNSPEGVMSRNTPEIEVTPELIDYCSINTYAYSNDGSGDYNNRVELMDFEANDLWYNGILKDIEAGNLGLIDHWSIYLEAGEETVEPTPIHPEEEYYCDISVEFSFRRAEKNDIERISATHYYGRDSWKYFNITEDCAYTMQWLQEHCPEAIEFEKALG